MAGARSPERDLARASHTLPHLLWVVAYDHFRIAALVRLEVWDPHAQ